MVPLRPLLSDNGAMRWKRTAALSGAIVMAAMLGLLIWALMGYNELTKIDRSNPKVVADQYLRALLIDGDSAGADLYACHDQKNLTELKTFRSEIEKRERDFDVTIVVSWGAYTQIGQDLTTELTVTALKAGIEESSNREQWRFGLVDDGGWRVCNASRLSSDWK